ncbi:hypothetical protein [Nocardia cyriacigeorgica]|uniref:hypothetical protein n=1 Tax=Nocardia cyriacigeorgica TaxID=135487 RepID=UPI00245810B6|nr:hypothetical protein [Nocardia cyriacigeorgica]
MNTEPEQHRPDPEGYDEREHDPHYREPTPGVAMEWREYIEQPPVNAITVGWPVPSPPPQEEAEEGDSDGRD